ncbi:MAG: DUF3078 domain-containing protein [Bacteroidales bacterium]
MNRFSLISILVSLFFSGNILNFYATENLKIHTIFSQTGSVSGIDTLKPVDTLTIENINSPNDSIAVADSASINDETPLNDSLASAVNREKNAESEAQAKNKEITIQERTEEPEEEPKPSNWKKGAQTSVNFSQISLSNWSSGGQNSMSFTSYMNAFLNFKTPDGRITWENNLDLGYGLINQENRRTIKSDDKIDISTKFGRKASEYWQYSSLINFRTQFAEGFKKPEDENKISDFMAPAYLNISVGMDHKFDDNISFYISPLAGRVIFVLDEELSSRGAFGVEEGETRRNEFGGFVRIQFNAELMENITANSRLELFSNYLDKPQNLDVNSDTRINMQINRYISANLTIQMRYNENDRIRVDTTGDGELDETLGPRIQLKQVFGLGFSYKF